MGLYLMRHDLHLLSQLDLLSYALLFVTGGILVWSRRKRMSFVSALFVPFIVAFFAALTLLFVDLLMQRELTLNAWLLRESQSLILPHFFHRETWIISKEAWANWALDFFDTVLSPILRDGVIGWFSAMIGFAYFMNGTIETMIRSFRTPQPVKRLKLWAEFNAWRAPDWVLVALLIGLAVLAYEISLGQRQLLVLRVFGWTLTVCALFPVFCQGICFASFLIPRASFLPFVLIFALLIINPVPVLLLAGLADLWFDLRSRMTASRS